MTEIKVMPIPSFVPKTIFHSLLHLQLLSSGLPLWRKFTHLEKLDSKVYEKKFGGNDQNDEIRV